MNVRLRQIGLLGLLLLTALSAHAQKRTPRPVKKTPPTTTTTAPIPSPQPTPAPSSKKNERPLDTQAVAGGPPTAKPFVPSYLYEFTRPGFTVPRIIVEHDTTGRGKISFEKQGFDDLISDPIELSAVTLEKINAIVKALDFVNSTEEYQSERDYSHMGNVTITITQGGKSRTVKYNWSKNPQAKALMDEYRRVANQYVWKFDISSARENQPLEAPGLMQLIDDMISRGDISDPPQLVPFLTDLSTDERLPLIARNRASKIIVNIGKSKK